MQITRAKAIALLNKGEMQLYDDSRHNPIRRFTAAQLESRVTRARAARDRARDLVRRQKLASRERTGSKRGASGAANQRSKDKVEILADILKRFETRLKDVKKSGKATAPARPARKLTPKQALRRTRKVLEAKQAQARQPRPWQEITGHGGQVPGDGFQSPGAARRAEELHAGESRLQAIQGSIGARDRINQGKRDSRGGDED